VQAEQIAAGTIIYHEGDPSDAVYMIESGAIEVLREHDRELMRLGVLRRGEIFGETGVILEHPRSTTMRALSASALIRIDRQRFLEIFPPDNPIALPLLRMLCERLTEANRQLSEVSTLSAGAAREHAGRMVLLGASAAVETQIGRLGLNITKLPFRIGRRSRAGEPPSASEGELLLSAQGAYQLSLQHCAITELGGTLAVRDLGSALGTLVNGKRIADFEGVRVATLCFGLNDIVAGGADSPYRFTLLIERK
jgi:CRP-like cAMP-binding protein